MSLPHAHHVVTGLPREPLEQYCPSLGSEHWVEKSWASPPEPGPGLRWALGGAEKGPKRPEAVGNETFSKAAQTT